MQSAYAQSFDREMACTQADWLRWLPAAVGGREWQLAGDGATVAIGAGQLRLAWSAGPARTIALVRLPRLLVSFRFEGVSAADRLAFMKRFDLYMQRGGG